MITKNWKKMKEILSLLKEILNPSNKKSDEQLDTTWTRDEALDTRDAWIMRCLN